MKKKSTLTLFLLLFTFCFATKLSAQSYHEDDKEVIREFLRQNSTQTDTPNFKCLGLTVSDTTSWYTSESWIGKMNNSVSALFLDWEWDFNYPSRLVRLDIKTLYTYLNSESPRLSGTLDCSNLTELVYLNCSDSKLTDLTLMNPKLVELQCANNQLNSLDVSSSLKLQSLDCSNNNISDLNISSNTSLKTLSCSGNNISKLDVSDNTGLILLNCSNNQLGSLNVETNTKLVSLYCAGNKLTGLTIGDDSVLEVLNCSENQLGSLDISQSLELQYLLCAKNKFEELNVSACDGLLSLDCSNNKLVSLDLSSNRYLDELNCSYNLLSDIKINTDEILFRSLICNDNNLRFSTLPIIELAMYKELIYAPQNDIVAGDIIANSYIDLSDEYSIKSNITSYVWHEQDNESNILSAHNVREGVYSFDNDYKDMQVVCKMTNTSYADLTLYYKAKILKDTITGIDDSEFVQGSLIYPNPVEDNMFIRISEGLKAVEIYTVTGALARRIEGQGLGESIQVQDLQSGMYLVKIITQSGKTIVEKIKKN